MFEKCQERTGHPDEGKGGCGDRERYGRGAHVDMAREQGCGAQGARELASLQDEKGYVIRMLSHG